MVSLLCKGPRSDLLHHGEESRVIPSRWFHQTPCLSTLWYSSGPEILVVCAARANVSVSLAAYLPVRFLNLNLKDVLGARLIRAGARSKEVRFLVMARDDFHLSIHRQLRIWHTNLHFKWVPGRQSNRGLLEYQDHALGRKPSRGNKTRTQHSIYSF